MKKFVFKDHKADMFIEGYGKSFPEALENVAMGLFETIADSAKLKSKKKIVINENANNLQDLTAYILNKVVSEGDAREMMFKKLKVVKFLEKNGNFNISVIVIGQEAEHKLGRMYVKAITHHEATVKKEKNKWTIKILPDI